jgi:hypothetical protein
MFIIRSRAASTAAQVLRRQQRSLLTRDSGLSCLANRGRRCAAVCRLHTLHRPILTSSEDVVTCASPVTSFTQHAFRRTYSSSSSNDQQQQAAHDSQARSQLKDVSSRQHRSSVFAASTPLQPLQARGLCSLSSARFHSSVSTAAASRQQPTCASDSATSRSLQRRSMQTQRGGGLPPPLPPWQRLLFNLLGFTVICVGATLVFTFGSELTLMINFTISY